MRKEETNNPQPLPESPVDVLEQRKRQKIEEHAAEMRLLDQAINRLKGGNGHSPVAAGMFRGLDIKDAATVYLNLSGGKAQTSEILDALKQGGCEMGPYPERNLSITIGSNKKLFKRDEQTNTVVLLKGK